MAKKKVTRRKKIEVDGAEQEFGEEVEVDEDDNFMDAGEDESDHGKDVTFADAEGTPANKHAKAKAKEEAANKKKAEPSASFYTLKNLTKVVKIVVKARGVYEIYVGNMKRHAGQLDGLVKVWKKQGEWVEAHERKAKVRELRAALPKAKR